MEIKKHKGTIIAILTFFSIGLIFMSLTTLIKNKELSEISNTQFLASVGDYQALAPIEGLNDSGEVAGIEEYLPMLFNWGIAIAVILSIMMTIYGGIKYMTTDAVFNKTQGRSIITNAITGLLLALSAWIILKTINPQILEPDLNIRTYSGQSH